MSSPVTDHDTKDGQLSVRRSVTAANAGDRPFSSLFNSWWAPLILIAIAIPTFAWGSGRLPLTGPDEPRYAAIARAMFETGDYITPRLGGQPWFEKPALTYWLMAGGYKIFGVNEFGARFPAIVLAALTALMLYFTGRRLVSARFGFFAGLVFETSLAAIVFGRGAATDMPLTATYTLAICAFLLAEFDGGGAPERPVTGRRSVYLAVFYAALGLSALAKGLVGIVLAGGVIGLFLLLTGRLRRFLGLHLIWGAALMVAVSSVWYGPVIKQYGWPFINEFFVQHHFARFTSNKYHHPGPFYYYLIAIFVSIFPWSFSLIASLVHHRPGHWRIWRVDKEMQVRLFAIAWLAFPVIFLSISDTKLPSYILPAVPAAAWLVAAELDDLWTGRATRGAWLGLGMNSLYFLGAGLALPFLAKIGITLGYRLAMAAINLTVGLCLVVIIRGRSKYAGLIPAAGLIILMLVIAPALTPQMSERQSVKPLAMIALAERRPGERIVFVGDLPRTVHGFTFYVDSQVVYDEDRHGLTPDQLAAAATESPSLLCVLAESDLMKLKGNQALSVMVLGRQRNLLLARVTKAIS